MARELLRKYARPETDANMAHSTSCRVLVSALSRSASSSSSSTPRCSSPEAARLTAAWSGGVRVRSAVAVDGKGSCGSGEAANWRGKAGWDPGGDGEKRGQGRRRKRSIIRTGRRRRRRRARKMAGGEAAGARGRGGGRGCDSVAIRIGRCRLSLAVIRGNHHGWSAQPEHKNEMPLLQLPTACGAAAASSAPGPFSLSRPAPSRLRASHVLFAFPRLRKYGRRSREPVPTTLDDEEEADEDDDDDDVEEAVDEDIFLKNRPKPAGFGVGKTYTTDVEEQLLREMGIGGAGRKSKSPPPKSVKTNGSATETAADRSNDGVHVRIWNLPKKKNIHKDLNLAFKGFPGLVTINPANSGTKKTRDPICKGFAFVKLESVDAATRFVELYSRKAVLFGKVEKQIKCCIVEGHVSTDPSDPASSIQPPGSNPQRLVAVR